jgi:hypothetical protein
MKSGPGQRLYLSVVGGIDVLRVVDLPYTSGDPSHPKGGVDLMTGQVEGLTGGSSVTIQRLMFVSTPSSLLSDMCLLPSSSALRPPASLGSSTVPPPSTVTTVSEGGNVSIVGIDRGIESALACVRMHLQPTAFAPQASSAAVIRRLFPLIDSHGADTTDTAVATGLRGMAGVTDTTDMKDAEIANGRRGGSVAVDDIVGCCPARSRDGTQPAVAAWLVDRSCGCHPLQFNK